MLKVCQTTNFLQTSQSSKVIYNLVWRIRCTTRAFWGSL